MNSSPVFVVGAPRSGTTLLASAIASHPEFTSGPETHFFSKTTERQRERAAGDVNWPSRAVALLGGLELAGQRVIELFGVTEAELVEYLKHGEPALARILASLFEAGDRSSATRWVEKTPNHILHIPEIAKHFPHAIIVHVVRDPRDVARSMTHLPWATPSRLSNSWLWLSWITRLERDLMTLGDISLITVRYEDFLSNPESELVRLCKAFSVAFDPGMLQPEKIGQSLASKAEVWKSKNSTPIDPKRSFAWKQSADDTDRSIERLTSSLLHRYGYESNEQPAVARKISTAYVDHNEIFRMESNVATALRRGAVFQPSDPRSAELIWMPSAYSLFRRRRPRIAVRTAEARARRSVLGLPTQTFDDRITRVDLLP